MQTLTPVSERLTAATLIAKPVFGSERGVCVVCCGWTERGHLPRFKSSFTSYNYLKGGDVVCEYCYILFNDPQIRKNSWVATREGLHVLTRDQILDTILHPPKPPFYLYVTWSRRKYGYLQADVTRVSRSRERYWLAHEQYDSAIPVDASTAHRMASMARAMRAAGLPKSELASMNLSTRNMERLAKAGALWRYEQASAWKGYPLWEVIVYACP